MCGVGLLRVLKEQMIHEIDTQKAAEKQAARGVAEKQAAKGAADGRQAGRGAEGLTAQRRARSREPLSSPRRAGSREPNREQSPAAASSGSADGTLAGTHREPQTRATGRRRVTVICAMA